MSVETVKVEVVVTKEAHELGQGLAKFVAACKAALDDGFQVGQDIPPIVSSALADLMPSIQGVDKLDDEAHARPIDFGKALALAGADIGELWVEPKTVPSE